MSVQRGNSGEQRRGKAAQTAGSSRSGEAISIKEKSCSAAWALCDGCGSLPPVSCWVCFEMLIGVMGSILAFSPPFFEKMIEMLCLHLCMSQPVNSLPASCKAAGTCSLPLSLSCPHSSFWQAMGLLSGCTQKMLHVSVRMQLPSCAWLSTAHRFQAWLCLSTLWSERHEMQM